MKVHSSWSLSGSVEPATPVLRLSPRNSGHAWASDAAAGGAGVLAAAAGAAGVAPGAESAAPAQPAEASSTAVAAARSHARRGSVGRRWKVDIVIVGREYVMAVFLVPTLRVGTDSSPTLCVGRDDAERRRRCVPTEDRRNEDVRAALACCLLPAARCLLHPHSPGIQYRCFLVRISNSPSATAGVARHFSPRSFSASSLASSPAAKT